MPALGIRAKLLLASSVFLLIPWLGYEYVRELERFLRTSQQQALLAASQAVALALHGRQELSASATEARSESGRDAIETLVEALEKGAGGEARGAAERAASATSAVEAMLRSLSRTPGRIWVVDRQQRVLAVAGTLDRRTEANAETVEPSGDPIARAWTRFEGAVLSPLFRPLYSWVLAVPALDAGEDPASVARLEGGEIESALGGIAVVRRLAREDRKIALTRAAHPIWSADTVVGAVVVEQGDHAVLAQRNRAFERLFNLVLTALLAGSIVLGAFATRLATRIRSLAKEAERAVDAKGRVRKLSAGERANDEIGDLSRSFSLVLGRLSEYSNYQEALASRLSHELRTPVAVVRSSLDNLAQAPDSAQCRVYVERAQQGLNRLNHILASMSAARRLEQMLAEAGTERFDLARLLDGCVGGYRLAHPAVSFELALPPGEVMIDGVPEAIAQALDKLVANALDFQHSGTPVRVGLSVARGWARVTVGNDGPLLQPEMRGRLFDAMVSIRTDAQAGSGGHLGLGLAIVRLVAEHHGGRAQITNQPDGSGVVAEFTLRAG